MPHPALLTPSSLIHSPRAAVNLYRRRRTSYHDHFNFEGPLRGGSGRSWTQIFNLAQRRDSMGRRLRITASWLFFILCCAFALGWFYSQRAYIYAQFPIANGSILIQCGFGDVLVLANQYVPELDAQLLIFKTEPQLENMRRMVSEGTELRDGESLGIMWRLGKTFWWTKIPLPYLAVAAAALWVLFRPSPRWRFSLRDLLAATTIVAGVAGGCSTLIH